MRALAWIGLAVLLSSPACSRSGSKIEGPIRAPAVAGMFYPADKGALRNDIREYLDNAAESLLDGRVFALIVPHAGYAYSGRVAGWGYRQIASGSSDRVIVLAPSHHAAFRGFAIAPVGAFATPLGSVPLDKDACDALRKDPLYYGGDARQDAEHSIEVQLPFLQVAMGAFKLVPVLIGSLEENDADALAQAIRPLVTPRTLIVVSSDFTHYGPQYNYTPFTDDLPKNLRDLDMGAVDLILKRDTAGYAEYLKERRPTICGREPIAVLMRLTPQSAHGEMLQYDTSGHITGDYQNSVSYVSIVFNVPTVKNISSAPLTPTTLTLDEQKGLLRLARQTIEKYLPDSKMPAPDLVKYPATKTLKERVGVFVTLKKDGGLRGCIGRIGYPESAQFLPALYDNVRDMSVDSATKDPRFPPVTPDELKDLQIEISVLSLAQLIDGPQDFQVGKHGIIIRKDANNAVFLPQIATEQHWTRDETLSQLCQKAGLPPDEWTKPGMRFYVFTAQVFEDSVLKK